MNVYQPRLQYVSGAVWFFRGHRGATFASSALMDPINKDFVGSVHRICRESGVAMPTADFTIDLGAKRATRGAKDIRLTPTEWHILEVLARTPGRIVGHQQLLRELWGPAYENQTNYLRIFIGALCRKLDPRPGPPIHLLNDPRSRYRLEL